MVGFSCLTTAAFVLEIWTGLKVVQSVTWESVELLESFSCSERRFLRVRFISAVNLNELI